MSTYRLCRALRPLRPLYEKGMFPGYGTHLPLTYVVTPCLRMAISLMCVVCGRYCTVRVAACFPTSLALQDTSASTSAPRSTSSSSSSIASPLRSIQTKCQVALSLVVVLLCQSSRFSNHFFVLSLEAIVSVASFFIKSKRLVNMKTQLALTVATLAVANAFSPSMNQSPAVSQQMMRNKFTVNAMGRASLCRRL